MFTLRKFKGDDENALPKAMRIMPKSTWFGKFSAESQRFSKGALSESTVSAKRVEGRIKVESRSTCLALGFLKPSCKACV